MNEGVEDADWLDAYVDRHNRSAALLMGVRRRGDRVKACRKVLVAEAATFASRAPAAISTPSREHALTFAEIAGAAWAARDVLAESCVVSEKSASPEFRAWAANRSALWGGQYAPGLMAASDGNADVLLPNFVAAGLDDAGRSASADALTQPAFDLEHAAAFLAQLTWAARPRSEAVHRARAEWLDRQLATRTGWDRSYVSAHAFAVHELTGVYGPGHDGVFSTMLGFIATHPPHERATLQASKVATLIADALGPRGRMALLDNILLLLGPDDDQRDVRLPRARDSALVLLLLDADDSPDVPAEEVASAPALRRVDQIAEIVGDTEHAAAAAATDRAARYAQAADAGAIAEAVQVIRDAAAAEDLDQAAALLQDLASRDIESAPVVVAAALESPADGDGCFTVLSPAPAAAAASVARVAPRLLNVDEHGREHPDGEIADDDVYTPNYLHDVTWCDRGAQVMLDTKGAMAPAMKHAMVAILVDALTEDRVPALLTGWVPGLDGAFVRWDGTE